MKPLVSIVIPVYNAEKFLEECLDSLIGQTYKELEIICVDDGSTDSSREIIHGYGKKDARVHLETQEHSNAGAARNKGLNRARGEFIAFLDADDFFEPAMIEKMVKKALDTQADCVFCRCIYYDNESGLYSDKGETRFQNAMIQNRDSFSMKDIGEYIFRLTACAWDKLYKTSFIKRNQLLFQEQPVNNDMLFTYKTYILAECMAICEDVAVRYRTNNVGSLQGRWGNNWKCIFNAFTALKDWLLQQGVWEQVGRGFVNHAATALTSYMGKLTEWKWYVDYFGYLQKEGIGKLELLPREEKYYYDPEIYKRMIYISDHNCEEYLLNLMTSLSKANKEGNLKLLHTREQLMRTREQFEHIKERLGKTQKQLEIAKGKQWETSLINRSKHWRFQEDRLPEGSRVVIYGCGEVGRDLINQFTYSCRLFLVAVADQNYERFSGEAIDVKPPEEVQRMEFDYVIIAIRDKGVAAEVSDMLAGEGIDRSRVVWFEMES